ncbi:MAG: hypothetical protein A3D24_00810 [Candidatus Blackburnbacteria bacterium RIFCSPHIGHO2_02_FULL_39_13]|uniref:Uncharacterized protein n=1 Tax=Candidatus Blackburnbacteria bacterium RIFCSPLOWO2_01_FULL_40_20 TaxID=1797519 RepID=A0A1G1VDY5_9BACT|nr:MAG: hypothetical protein A2694_00600 [Candidatus Blackburnbacteria bacterium RIFCSPHIGHO2_01_FULL_40_17]OGY09015.1 MAG: hypothetical protein A3D24_00810 [Candidatus Blackburnbacteria bacterium RIFCSPHIGHO2_02_FULL_39_13]OGY13683.1 MAG: hypothetical protein A3A77_01360 [Candidatus Blackburnbacteria bacterium RIFCSPLOWO2_01_FULL_40_20]OGY15087.1 MAG: hypothetical protein A3I52_03100 [Candidatus Blackburnbacteria bacterium RIFCSPLOWO2_02_FULL_40_10]HBL52301.1 hypothetical protein [Candidatus B
MTDISRNLAHYLSLIAVLIFALWGLLAFSYDKNFQTAISISATLGFFVWGIVHHYIHEDLYFKVVLEYMATSLLGIVVLLSAIWSA